MHQLEEVGVEMWKAFNFLPLEKVIEDFKCQEPNNEKVRKFKQLLKRYEDKQKKFEGTCRDYSPYHTGYGNITSPIWFMGEAEGGPDSYESWKYNRYVKTNDVLSEASIISHVFVNPYDLLKQFGLEEYFRDGYVNFERFAGVILYETLDVPLPLIFNPNPLRGRMLKIMKPNIPEIRKTLGYVQFFTEYWRYLCPPGKLEEKVHININSGLNWDREREIFLKDLDDTLQPHVIIAYPPANKKFQDNKTTRDKIKDLFQNTNRLIDITDKNLLDDTTFNNLISDMDKKERPIIITKWPSLLTDEEIYRIGKALNCYFKTRRNNE